MANWSVAATSSPRCSRRANCRPWSRTRRPKPTPDPRIRRRAPPCAGFLFCPEKPARKPGASMSEVNPRQGRLACIYFFAMAGLVIGNLMGRIPALKEQTQLDERALGQALLGVGVGALTAFPLSGFLVQRIGSRSVVIGGCLIMLLVFPLLGLSQGWWQLALAFYVLGVSFAGMDVAMNIQAVDVERLLGKPCMSMLHGMYSLGCLVGALSAAALAGLTPFWHFLILTALGLLSLPFFVRALLPPDPSKAGARKGGGFTLPPRALLGLGLLILCAFVSEGGVADWSAAFWMLPSGWRRWASRRFPRRWWWGACSATACADASTMRHCCAAWVRWPRWACW
ncbi:MFS transporter [Pseudomonas aeruginosa]|nr:MFS transporter [Pseudomonas aeruginosa]